MSTITLSKRSHEDPSKYRVDYKSAKLILDRKLYNAHLASIERSKDVLESSSGITIIGTGFGGIGAALSCIKNLKTDDFVMFEKHNNFGGTWWANTYPGCASDIPAVWYSFHDELVSNWSDIRPPQYEVEEYIQNIVKKYGLESKARFGTAVEQAKFDETTQTWVIDAVDMATGQRLRHTTKLLASCTGGLVTPNVFNPPGMDKFKGDYMHSGIWDWSVDFEDKKVIVIGNGCSAAQVVPALLEYKPQKITQIVRSQHHIFPPHPSWLKRLYFLLSWNFYGIAFVRLLIATAAEGKYPMYTGNSWVSRFCRWIHTRMCMRYMKSTIPEKYHKILIPDFKIGCKRLIYDYYYAPTLQNPKINVLLDEIAEVKEKSVILKDGSELEVDIIVACTGYNIKHSMNPYNIIGRGGNSVRDLWAKTSASSYETILVKDCPNFFTIAGPNSATGHSSVVLAIENGCAFFTQVAAKVLDGTYKSVCVKDDKYDEWFETTQRLLSASVFGTKYGGCVSWYSDDYNSTAYPYSQIEYYKRMRKVRWDEMDIVRAKDI